jgi:ATP-dependent DNA helicase DinG
MKWEKHFPHPTVRREQKLALDFIESQIEAGVDDVLVEAPTGIGKSAMAVALGETTSANICTSTIELQEQYLHSYEYRGLKLLKGSSNYQCKFNWNCEVGKDRDCPLWMGLEEMAQCSNLDKIPCPYQRAREKFDQAQVGIANVAFLSRYARARRYSKPHIVVLDEAHKVGEILCQQFAFTLHRKLAGLPKTEEEALVWLQDAAKARLAIEYARLENLIDNCLDEKQTLQWMAERLQIEHKLNAIKTIGETPADGWVAELFKDKLTIAPKWPYVIAPKILTRMGYVRVWLSATIIGWQKQAEWLGLDPESEGTQFLRLKSPCPLKNRPIFALPRVRWRWRDGYESAFPKAAQACEAIIRAYPNQRGLIHCSSFEQAWRLFNLINSPRVFFYERGREAKQEALVKWFSDGGFDQVLISANSHEGLDLKDDLCRFQILVKLPFPGQGEKVTKARMESDDEWYNIRTTEKIVQAAGRAIRSETAFADTYILDSLFSWFYFKQGAFDLVPKWFHKAIQWEG